MALPVVAIVGRPNVGKSSLFNWLAGKRIAIVDPTAGVTSWNFDFQRTKGDILSRSISSLYHSANLSFVGLN